MKTRSIQIAPPTWAYAVEIYMAALEDGTGEGKEAARAEFRRMARLLDSMSDSPEATTGADA